MAKKSTTAEPVKKVEKKSKSIYVRLTRDAPVDQRRRGGFLFTKVSQLIKNPTEEQMLAITNDAQLEIVDEARAQRDIAVREDYEKTNGSEFLASVSAKNAPVQTSQVGDGKAFSIKSGLVGDDAITRAARSKMGSTNI